MTNPFIKSLPLSGTTSYPCTAIEAGLAEARQWNSNIQPLIKSAPGVNTTGKNWHWPALYWTTKRFEKRLGRDIAYFQYVCTSPTLQVDVPVGQVLLSVGYPFALDTRQPCIYLWFLVATPPSVLQQFGLQKAKMLAPLVDIAIQVSYLCGFDGRMFLHAHPTGGQPLMNEYQKIGLLNVPRGISIGKKANDGRYFYTDNQTALVMSQQLDYLR